MRAGYSLRPYISLRPKWFFFSTMLGCICILLILFPGRALTRENSEVNEPINLDDYGRITEKRPTPEQLKAAKGVGSITWSTKTGGPLSIMGDLTPPSEEDHEVITWRFLEEKKVLYGMKNPHEDLSIKTIINGKYDTTIHFQQRYKGVLVEAYLVVDILPNGVIHGMGGEYFPDIEADITPQISSRDAVDTAIRHRKACKATYPVDEYPSYLCENNASEAQLIIRPTEGEDPLLWYFEVSVIIRPTEGEPLLWYFEVIDWKFYIDAHSGEIFDVIFPPPPPEAYAGIDLEPKIQVTPECLDFGEKQINSSENISKEITFSNIGDDFLVIKSVRVHGESFMIEGPFKPAEPLSLLILPGNFETLKIGFFPSGAGEVTGTLCIESIDPDRPFLEIPLKGAGVSDQPVSHKEKSSFSYDLSPYGVWRSPLFSLSESSGTEMNQNLFYPPSDYLFPWNYICHAQMGSSQSIPYSYLSAFSSQFFLVPPFDPYYYFPFYSFWQ